MEKKELNFNEMYDTNTLMTTIYSESVGTGEVRGFIEDVKIDNKDEITPFLKISKILYNHTSEVYGLIKLSNPKELTEEDIFRYFEESEQIRTHVNFTNKINIEERKEIISQSFIIQKMPGCDNFELEKKFEKIINNANFKNIEQSRLSYSKLNQIFEDLNYEVEMRRTPIQFFCRCSKESFKRSLLMLGKYEIEDMKEKNQRSILCKTCNTEYSLENSDFDELLSKL
jgi:molecular chaperone Hsp33